MIWDIINYALGGLLVIMLLAIVIGLLLHLVVGIYLMFHRF